MAIPQVEHWFRLADEDRDGGVGGAEAVRFFTKSGLPQEVLGQIWEYASGGGAKLNMGQFSVAMRLVALAQASGGRLLPDQARVVAMGGGPQLPPPRLAGVTDAPAPHIPTYTPQITGLTPQPSSGGGVGYTPQPTGGYMPQVTGGYPQQQMTGVMRPPSPYGAPPAAAAAGPTGAYTPQATGYMPGAASPTGGMAPAAAGMSGVGAAGGAGTLPGFPPVTLADMQRYQATFAAVDADRDGFTKGAECFPVFMKSGLDKALLKRMWDLVAGNAGSLNAQQFCKCMYLMDGCRRGAALPAVLPPGPWPQVSMASPAATGMTGPPGMMQQQQQQPAAAAAGYTGGMPGHPGLPPQLSAAGSRESSSGGMAPLPGAAPLRADSWTLENQFGNKGAIKAISDAYDQTLPRIPELPGKITYSATAATAAGPSSVPDLDATIANMLAPADKARWEAERAEALEKERQEQATKADAAAAKARLEAFQTALSELVVYKSRINVALLQADDSAARLAAEAEDTELRYNKARLAAASQEEEGNAARSKLQALLARKQEAANKLELLQQEISMMANLNPAELAALEKEVGGLVAAMAAAESKKAAMEMQLDSGKKQKGLLAERIADMELAAAAGEGDIRRARAELAELEAKLAAARSVAQGSPDLGEVGPLLGKAASAYRRLYSSAAAAGLEVPYEANLNNVGSLVWLEQLMAGTADWVDDDAALSGYTVVNALPDLEGVPPALLRAAALAAAQQPPIKPQAAAAGASEETADIAAAENDDTAEAAAPAEAVPGAAAADGAAAETRPQAEVLPAERQEEVVPAAAPAEAAAPQEDAGKGVVAAVASTAAAAVASVAGVVASVAAGAFGHEDVSNDDAAAGAPAVVPAVDDAAAGAAAVPADAAHAEAAVPAELAAAGAAGSDDDAFWDGAFASEAATAASAEQHAAGPDSDTAVSAAANGVDTEAVAEQEAAAAEAAAELPASAVSAELSQLASPADGAAEAAAGAGISIEPPMERHFADEDDSDITSPLGHHLMSAVPAAAGGDTGSSAAAGTVPVIGGLAGFDPSMYRLNTEQQQQLVTQYSMDSSYAGSMAGGAAAGVTGASSSNGFGDDAAFGDSSTPGGEGGKTAGGLMGFEDNAF